MGSRKRSALRRQQEQFRQELGELDLGGAFDAERDRARELEAERDAGRRARGCERKQRYATRAEAQAALERVAARNERWEHDPRWNDDDED